MSGGERLELAHQLGVAAESQVGLDSLLERRDTQFFEPRDLVLSERVHGEVGKWRAAPECETFEQRATRQPRTARTECTSALREEPFESLGVELVRLDPKHISGRTRDQDALAPPPRERLSQL